MASMDLSQSLLGQRMRALTLQQPFAAALIHGPKRSEARPFKIDLPSSGLWVLIHCGKSKRYLKHTTSLRELWPECPHPNELLQYSGMIVGAALVTQIRKSTEKEDNPWASFPSASQYVWEFSAVHVLPEPQPHAGQLRIWWARRDVTSAILLQLGYEVKGTDPQPRSSEQSTGLQTGELNVSHSASVHTEPPPRATVAPVSAPSPVPVPLHMSQLLQQSYAARGVSARPLPPPQQQPPPHTHTPQQQWQMQSHTSQWLHSPHAHTPPPTPSHPHTHWPAHVKPPHTPQPSTHSQTPSQRWSHPPPLTSFHTPYYSAAAAYPSVVYYAHPMMLPVYAGTLHSNATSGYHSMHTMPSATGLAHMSDCTPHSEHPTDSTGGSQNSTPRALLNSTAESSDSSSDSGNKHYSFSGASKPHEAQTSAQCTNGQQRRSHSGGVHRMNKKIA